VSKGVRFNENINGTIGTASNIEKQGSSITNKDSKLPILN